MTCYDLCAGAGGLSLGLQRAGWDVLGVEQDEDAVATHRAQVGPCDLDDLRAWHPPGPAVLVAGGVPCQSFSQAGLKAGTADPRGQLYLELLRVAAEARAQVWLLENVRGLVSRGLDEIRSEAERQGWLTRWALLDAADYGVPQHRRRLFLVGSRGPLLGWRWPAQTHGPGGLLGLQPWVTVRQALGLSGAPGGSIIDRPAPCVSAGGTAAGGAEPFANTDVRRRLYSALSSVDSPAPCVTATENKAGACFGSEGAQTDPRRAGDRLGVRLSVAQLAALQGFPPGFAFAGNLTSQYRQVGNAVPPPLGEAMGRALMSALQGGL